MSRSSRLLALVVFLVCSTDAVAQVLTFEDELFVVIASASPDSSFVGGIGNTSLTIDQSTGDFGGSGMSDGLIQFLDFSVSPLAVVKSATLNFTTTSFTNGPVDVLQMTRDWNANATWNDFGGDGVTPGVDTLSDPFDSLIDLEEDLVASFDVTEIVAAWAGGADNFGFGIRNNSTDGWDVLTVDEGGFPAPFLTVEIEVPAPARLEIDSQTGFGKLVSLVDFDFELRGYELLNELGELDGAGWSATNLDARNVDTGDPTDPGNQWQTVNDEGVQLFEAYLLGVGSTMSPGEELLIGRVVDPANLQQGDLELPATLITTNFLGGGDEFNTFSNMEVVFTDFQQLPGDFNADGRVDNADYVSWREGLGTTFSDADFEVWRLALGASAVSPPPASVPEPAAVCLVITGILGIGVSGRRA